MAKEKKKFKLPPGVPGLVIALAGLILLVFTGWQIIGFILDLNSSPQKLDGKIDNLIIANNGYATMQFVQEDKPDQTINLPSSVAQDLLNLLKAPGKPNSIARNQSTVTVTQGGRLLKVDITLPQTKTVDVDGFDYSRALLPVFLFAVLAILLLVGGVWYLLI